MCEVWESDFDLGLSIAISRGLVFWACYLLLMEDFDLKNCLLLNESNLVVNRWYGWFIPNFKCVSCVKLNKNTTNGKLLTGWLKSPNSKCVMFGGRSLLDIGWSKSWWNWNWNWNWGTPSGHFSNNLWMNIFFGLYTQNSLSLLRLKVQRSSTKVRITNLWDGFWSEGKIHCWSHFQCLKEICW